MGKRRKKKEKKKKRERKTVYIVPAILNCEISGDVLDLLLSG